MKKAFWNNARRTAAGAPIVLCLIAGCAANKEAAEHATFEGARAALPAGPEQNAKNYPPSTPIDLTEEGAWTRETTEVELIDTRTFPQQIQVTGPWQGPITRVKHILPPHTPMHPSDIGPANDLVAGGVTGGVRTHQGPLFPAIGQTPWSPPDPTLAVGPNHIVATVNMDIAWYDKAGNLQFQSRMDNTGNPGFFEGIGAGNFTFDPKCFYDHLSGRFVVIALEVYGSTQSWIDIAVSDDSDPNGVWYKYRTNSVVQVGSNTYWIDYPGFGYDGQAYYVTGNLFGLNNGGWAGVLYRSFDKIPLLSGQPAVYTNVRDGNAASVQAVQHFGSNQAPFFVSVASTTAIKLQAVRNPLTSPTIVSSNVSVPSFAYPTGGAPNKNGGSIDVLDGRMMNACWKDGRLVAGHGVRLSSKNQARWYEFATNNWPTSGSPTLIQSGNIDGGSGVHTYFPAVYFNNSNAIGLAMASSSSTAFASVQYTGRRAGDAAGTMGAPTQAAIGDVGTQGRWGDYFDMALDPDGNTFWLIGEYAKSFGWQTWISSFKVTCTADFNGDGSVNTLDITAFLNAWAAGSSSADWNHDGSVNTLDVIAYLNAYNGPC